ncbi:hypothetical protein RRG08_005747 [Elysia crispata]|uniref:Uncharacterized protein n=1 Tax=Elysia crispata TaxID=231223 RepID=A0AAE0YCR5_9GAST|nr:hypothetical protein RRG08_005747 [Elysia crispata]
MSTPLGLIHRGEERAFGRHITPTFLLMCRPVPPALSLLEQIDLGRRGYRELVARHTHGTCLSHGAARSTHSSWRQGKRSRARPSYNGDVHKVGLNIPTDQDLQLKYRSGITVTF